MNEQNTERTVTRPQWSKYIKGRAIIKYRRACSAYDLAALVCGETVTETEYNNAAALLDSVQRYALADAAQWERANTYEHYANSTTCKADEERLERRRAKLEKRLDRYGVKLINYGLYPSIVTPENRDLYLLHYYE